MYSTWARLLKNLVDPALDILIRREDRDGACSARPKEIFWASELVGNVERLLIEMFSGNETLIPKRYWSQLGVYDGIMNSSWPQFDPEFFDLRRNSMNLECWPRTEDDMALIFIQEPAVRYHFSIGVVTLQRDLLEGVVHLECVSRMTKNEVLSQGRNAVDRAFTEWREAVKKAMEFDIERRVAQLPRQGDPERAEARQRLGSALELVRDDPGIFEERYDLSNGSKTDCCRVLSRYFGLAFDQAIPEEGRGTEIGKVAQFLLDTAKSGDKICRMRTSGMTWHIRLQAAYKEGNDRNMRDAEWTALFTQRLVDQNIEFLPRSNGGRLDPQRFERVLRPDVTRLALYGQPRPAAAGGLAFFDRIVSKNNDMTRIFGADALPLRARPHLVTVGLDKNATSRQAKQERKDAIQRLFEGANIEIPFVRLVYYYCVILNAHRHIVQAGGKLCEKTGWVEPQMGTKHRTDRELWATAFCFSALYQSNIIRHGVDDNTFKQYLAKGYLGTMTHNLHTDFQNHIT